MQLFKPEGDSIRGRICGQTPSRAPEASQSGVATEPIQGPIWQPVSSARSFRAPPAVAIPNESELLQTCTAPIAPEDGHRVGNERKEQRLAQLFDQLTSIEALTLSKRLANPQSTDELAMAFENRFSIERRKRLVAYLGSSKRRAALGR